MANESIIGVGILGHLSYDEYQHFWAIELGHCTESYLLVHAKGRREILSTEDEPSLRQRTYASINEILSKRSYHITLRQLEIACGEDVQKVEAEIGKLVYFREGESGRRIWAMYILGLCAATCGYWWSIAGRERIDSVIKDWFKDIEHHSSRVGIQTEALRKIFLEQGPEGLTAIHISRLLVNLSRPVTVLTMSPDPRDVERLRLPEERRELQEAVDRSRLRGSITVHDIPSCRVRDVTEALDRYNPNILHFCGHGTRSDLCFEDDQGNVQNVDKRALARLLATQKALKLVILNACYSKDLAQAIADAVGYVIGVEGEILDDDAKSFSRQFYGSLGHGRTFQEAFDRAESALGLTSSLKVHLLMRRTAH